VVGVRAICGEFQSLQLPEKFEVISFNKVLEHVHDPVSMLARASTSLVAEGFVYVEVPDGEAAAALGPGREEFFIDHPHIFSKASLSLLARQAGFDVRLLERLQEPSGKHTLRAFLVPGSSPMSDE
jgi:hypothetical protein